MRSVHAWSLSRQMQQQPNVQPRPVQALPADLLQECKGGFGRLRFLRPVTRMSLTPPAWTLSAVPLGTHAACIKGPAAL